VDVPIHFEGASKGVKEGAQLDHHLWTITVECPVTSVPENISVDISELDVGDTIRVGDLDAGQGNEILTGADEVVVSCIVPQEMKVEAEIEAPAEPEVAGAEAPAAEAAGESSES